MAAIMFLPDNRITRKTGKITKFFTFEGLVYTSIQERSKPNTNSRIKARVLLFFVSLSLWLIFTPITKLKEFRKNCHVNTFCLVSYSI